MFDAVICEFEKDQLLLGVHNAIKFFGDIILGCLQMHISVVLVCLAQHVTGREAHRFSTASGTCPNDRWRCDSVQLNISRFPVRSKSRKDGVE